ncbi:tryptophan halogenase family protein [Pseudoalteromonas fenneropenaei]|uniref:Tryptophan halogenase family protein n=1 Tax=Pseudoalteromonas fenneropenaei TaxID=1737459 RepID=A0ABV7CNG4_9GAMM
MQNKNIKSVVIVGGGTAGWITATLLAKVLGKTLTITLVESDDIATIGVGEASIPPIQPFNQALGINEADFIRATKATIKLGIQFQGWGSKHSSYMHAFGGVGKNFPFCDFFHFWLRGQEHGLSGDFWHYSLNYQAALHSKFQPLNHIPGTQLPGISYAYHFDAGLYARFLRELAEQKGVKRQEGKIVSVQQCPQSGFVTGLTLADGQTLSGDLFVDCSGLHALLIDKTLNSGFDDWSHWLPCDRALAVPSELPAGTNEPFTRSIAHQSGWQWRIPLQHRCGNGLVYSSRYLSDEDAKALLMANLPAPALAEPRLIKFRTGRVRQPWSKNVVAVGLASGFLEPLESTSIHLIQTAVVRLIKYFPHQGIAPTQVDVFNRLSKIEFERIRDFIILHYKLNQRDDSAFWRACQQMDIPPALQQKLALYQQTGKLLREDDELFTEIAWQQVLLGQGMVPEDYHPLANSLTTEQLQDLFASLKSLINSTVASMPSHHSFLESHRGD